MTNIVRMDRREIFFVLGNHQDPCGQWDFINCLVNIFDKSVYTSYGLDWPSNLEAKVTLTQEIVPNEINVLLEGFDCGFGDHLADIRHKYSKTQYVVILTEFPTVSEFGYLSFNSFTRAEEIWSMVVRLKCFPSKWWTEIGWVFERLAYDLDDGGEKYRNHLWRYLFSQPMRSILKYLLSLRYVYSFVRRCLKDVSRENDRLVYEDRLAGLLRIRDEVSMYLVAHPELVSLYGRLSFDALEELPLLFSSTPIKYNSNRPNSIFFSGNLTKYRENELEVSRKHLWGPYQQYQYIEDVLNLFFEFLVVQSVDEDKFRNIIEDGLLVYLSSNEIVEYFKRDNIQSTSLAIENVRKFFAKFSEHYPPIFIVALAYANQLTIDSLPRYEIYIPQTGGWKWSSPIRTFRSLYYGLHPINMGSYSDHNIANVASQAKDNNELRDILVKNGSIDQLLIRAEQYHKDIYPSAVRLADHVLELPENLIRQTSIINSPRGLRNT